MAISKLPTSASLKQVMDKFEEISLQDFSKGIDIEVRSSLPSDVKEDKIVIINNENLKVYFVGNDSDTPSNSIGINYTLEKNSNDLYLDLKASAIKLYLKSAFKNINNVCSNLDAYIGKNGKWQQFSYKVFYIYSPPDNIMDGITSSANWVIKSASSPITSSMSNNVDYLHFESANQTGTSSVALERYFNQAINVTPFKILKIAISSVEYGSSSIYQAGRLGLTSDITNLNKFEVSAITYNANETKYELDVSNLTGNYYLAVRLASSGTGETGAKCKIRIYNIEFS